MQARSRYFYSQSNISCAMHINFAICMDMNFSYDQITQIVKNVSKQTKKNNLTANIYICVDCSCSAVQIRLHAHKKSTNKHTPTHSQTHIHTHTNFPEMFVLFPQKIRSLEKLLRKRLDAERSKHFPPIKRGCRIDVYLTSSGQNCQFSKFLYLFSYTNKPTHKHIVAYIHNSFFPQYNTTKKNEHFLKSFN